MFTLRFSLIFFISLSSVDVFSYTSTNLPIVLKSKNKQNLSISIGLYDDIRIIGENSYWVLKKKNLQTIIFYKKNILEALLITRFENKRKIELLYKKNGAALSLSGAFVSPERSFNYTVFTKEKSGAECSAVVNNQALSLLSPIADKINHDSLYDSIEGGVIDPTCKTVLGSKDLLSLAKGLGESFEYRDTGNETNLTKCLKENKDIQSAFASTPADKESLDLLIAKLKLESAKVYSQSQQVKPLISCSKANAPSPIAQCTESGSITFFQTAPPQTFENTERLVSHELLHKVGVTDEKIADNILKVCLDNKPMDLKTRGILKNTNSFTYKNAVLGASTSLSMVSAATTPEISQDVASAVPKEISPEKVQLPTTQQLAATATISTATDSGVSKVVQQSTQQSSGIMSFAEQVTAPLLGTPALAAPPVLANNSLTVPALSTAGGAGARAPASVSTFTASTVNPGEHVVEEIDLSQKSAASATATTGVDMAATTVAATSRFAVTATGTQAVAKATAANTEVGGSSGGGGSNAGGNFANIDTGSGFSSGTTGTGRVARAAQRSPSSLGTAQTFTPAREELMTFFLKSDYQSARQKLQDPNMQKNLRTNDMTVIDLNGKSIGAARGKTIILDQGDRFVQQK